MIVLRALVATFVMLILAAGCSTSGPTGDPKAVVEQALQLVEQGQFDDVANLACEAKKNDIVNALGLEETLPEGAAGLIDPAVLAPALTIDTDGLTLTEKDRATDRATIHMAGTLIVAVDKAKLVELLTQAGLPMGQGFVDTIVDGVIQRLADGVPIDQDLSVVTENGAWKIC